MHKCPVDGCDRNVGPAYLMCRTDWWRVRPETRQLVYDTHDDYSRASLAAGPPEWRAVRDAYLAARGEAISQAEESRARSAAKAGA